MIELTNDGCVYKIKLPDNIDSQLILDILKDKNVERYWHSKYNSYVIYDYEPYNSVGFYLVYQVILPNDPTNNFILYTLRQTLNKINKLEAIYNTNVTIIHTTTNTTTNTKNILDLFNKKNH